jgi:chromosomal replication initiator protein
MTSQLIFDFPVEPRLTFSTLVVCDGNRTAVAFAERLTGDDTSDNLLYLHGPAGCGKSHLLQAVAARLGGAHPAPTFSFKEADGVAAPTLLKSLNRRFADAKALLLDDIHLAPADPAVRVPLWQLFNTHYEAGHRIVVTGATPPKELHNLDEHLISRLLWGLVAKMDITDDDSRRMIMKKLAADRQIVLPADVIDFLLGRLPRDIPTLVTALDTINRLALARKRKVSVPLAKEALESLREGWQPAAGAWS